MAYQLRKNNFSDTLELVGADGNVEKKLEFEIHVDVIAPNVRRKYVEIVEAERAMRYGSFEEKYAAFSEAVREMLKLCFGEENTEEIVKFYNGDFIDISIAIVPYIYEVIIPKTTEAIIHKRNALKSLYKNKRKGI